MITIVTCNAAGGKPSSLQNIERLGNALAANSPDFVALQELTISQHEDRVRDTLQSLAALPAFAGYQSYFAATVDTARHPCPDVVPDTANKAGKWNNPDLSFWKADFAAQGNGFLIGKGWQAVHLYNGQASGQASPRERPAIIQINQPGLFLGDRESEPRILLVIRVRHEDGREVILGNTHLSKMRSSSRDATEGTAARSQETTTLARILKQLAELTPGLPLILAGDFNAGMTATELEPLRQYLTHASATCSDADKELGTHITSGEFVDHIWIRNGTVTKCTVLSGVEGASDHRPVVAQLETA